MTMRTASLALVCLLLLVVCPALSAATVSDIRCAPLTGTRGTGSTVTIAVTFTGGTVDVTTGSTLHLDVGRAANDAFAVCTAGGMAVTTATFAYTVAAGDVSSDLDYTDTGALTGVANYTGTLAPPGTNGSLSNTSSVVIDGLAPSITLTAPSTISRTAPVNVTFATSESVTGLTSSDFTIAAGTGGALSGSTLPVTPGSPITVAANATAGATSISLQTASGSVVLAAGAPLKIGASIYRLSGATTITGTAGTVAIDGSLSNSVASGTAVFPPTKTTVTVGLPAASCTDAAGNPNTAATSVSFDYDPVPPVATIPVPADGASVEFDVTFSEVVVDALTAGELTITNGTLGSIDGTANPLFKVMVTPNGPTGDVVLAVAADAVHDEAGNGNLAASQTLPRLAVQSVTSTPATATYGTGGVVTVTVTLNHTVAYTHAPGATLHLATGGSGQDAVCTAPTASAGAVSQLTFQYTVAAGDTAADLDYSSTSALDLHGSTLGGLGTLALPTPGASGSLAASGAVTIDGIAPGLTIVPAPPTPTAPFSVTVNATEAVTGLIASDFTVTGGSAAISGTVPPYALSIIPTSALTVAAAATAGSTNVDLIAATSAIALTAGAPLRIGNATYRVQSAVTVATTTTTVTLTTSLGAALAAATPVFTAEGTSITVGLDAAKCTDAAGNGNTAAPDVTFVYDPTPPTAVITPPGSSGSPLTFTVNFSEVIADALTIGALQATNGTVTAVRGAGNPSIAVDVTPTVAGSDVVLTLPAGVVHDATGNANLAATATFSSVDSTAPTLTLSAPGTAFRTQPIAVAIAASENVTGLTLSDVTLTGGTATTLAGSGSPYSLAVTPTSAITVAAAASAGVASVQLVSTPGQTLAANTPIRIGSAVYRLVNAATLGTTPVTVALAANLTSAVALNAPVFGPAGTVVTAGVAAGSCQDAASNPNEASNILSVIYDPTPPAATITTDSSGSVPVFVVTFSELTADTVVASGTTLTNCTVTAIDGSLNPVYRISVAATDSTHDFSLGLAAAAVHDDAGNASLVAGPVIFRFVPHVKNVTAINANGTYGSGVRLRIRAVFDEPVTVTGTPLLDLAMAAGPRTAVYTEGTGSDTLVFDYTIADGDSATDLDYTGITALRANSGTIRDADGNDAVLTLKIPGMAGSLGANADLRIDAGGPTGPAKPDTGDQPPGDGGGCGAGTGIACLLGLCWLAFGSRRRTAG